MCFCLNIHSFSNIEFLAVHVFFILLNLIFLIDKMVNQNNKRTNHMECIIKGVLATRSFQGATVNELKGKKIRLLMK